LKILKKNTELDEVIIIYCYHGNNSLGAAEYFSNMGYQNIYSLNGGFSEFKKQN
jgi:thiosulfate sulfurtransferase